MTNLIIHLETLSQHPPATAPLSAPAVAGCPNTDYKTNDTRLTTKGFPVSDVVIETPGLGKNAPHAGADEPGFEAMRRRVLDVTKIRRLTGWEPWVPLAEMLRQVIGYERANLS